MTEGEAEMSSVVPLDESAVVNYTGAADFYEQVIPYSGLFLWVYIFAVFTQKVCENFLCF